MDNLVPILLYIRNFREYRHRDIRDAAPRLSGRETIRTRTRARDRSTALSPSTSSGLTSSRTIGRSPSFRYKMQQVGEEIKELEKETSPEVERPLPRSVSTMNHIDSTSPIQPEDQDFDDYSKMTDFVSEQDFQINPESDDLEEQIRRALIANTFLDNQRHVYSFESDDLREEYNRLEDDYAFCRKQLKDKSRTTDLLTRDRTKLKDSCTYLEYCLKQRDRLLEENGLGYLQLKPFPSICDIKSYVNCDDGLNESCESDLESTDNHVKDHNSVDDYINLNQEYHSPVDQFVINFFASLVETNLEDRLKLIIDERSNLQSEVKRLKDEVNCKRKENLELEEKTFTESYRLVKSSDVQLLESQQENIHLLKEYRDKLNFANDEVARLKKKLTAFEEELERLKHKLNKEEKREAQLNAKKRQSLRQLREVEAKVDELEGLNNLYYKKLEKIKKSNYVG